MTKNTFKQKNLNMNINVLTYFMITSIIFIFYKKLCKI